jgi:hypothetical protein
VVAMICGELLETSSSCVLSGRWYVLILVLVMISMISGYDILIHFKLILAVVNVWLVLSINIYECQGLWYLNISFPMKLIRLSIFFQKKRKGKKI